MKITVERSTEEKVKTLGAKGWPVWECEESEFDWHYDEKETCVILEGEVEVATEEGSVKFSAGDIVVFPEGLSCRWKVKKHVRKHYRFG